MKKMIFKCSFITAIVATLGIRCAAATIPYTVTTDYANNTVKVEGTVEENGKYVVLQVLNKDCTFEDVKADVTNSGLILFRDQLEIKDDEYSFVIEYPDSVDPASYVGRLTSNGSFEKTDIVLNIVSDGDYKWATGEVNRLANAGNFEEFRSFVETHSASLGFDMTFYAEIRDTSALKPFMESVKKSNLSDNQSDSNTKLFNGAILMAAVVGAKADNIDDYIHQTVFAETPVYEDYVEFADTVEKQKYITQKIKGLNPESIDQFETALKQALVFGKILYANGYDEVQSVIKKYGSTLGISGSAPTKVYKEMAGEDYDARTIVSVFEQLKEKYSTTGGNGGSGGGSGKSSMGGGSSMNGIYQEGITQNIQKTDLVFHDIDSVQWAVEAIYALADKGIVKGKADGYFNPDDYVTREEFAKMLVCAMGYENSTYRKNVFSDVNSSDWFASYVNIAYEKGIIKGVGDGRFETGQMITRQDMVVMLYNSILSKEKALKPSVLSFSDSGDIADYAKIPVGVLFAEGIVNGVSETTFAPLETASRAQAAKIIYGALKYLQ